MENGRKPLNHSFGGSVVAKKKERVRALATPGSDIGIARHRLYRAGHDRIQQAIRQGWYLEAIALIESLLTDRLESRLSFLTGSNVAFQNLGPLTDMIRRHETIEPIKHFVAETVDGWRRERNSAVHEMLKLEVGEEKEWDDRMRTLRKTAVDGYAALKRLGMLTNTARRRSSDR